jgi:hypothetical protein
MQIECKTPDWNLLNHHDPFTVTGGILSTNNAEVDMMPGFHFWDIITPIDATDCVPMGGASQDYPFGFDARN